MGRRRGAPNQSERAVAAKARYCKCILSPGRVNEPDDSFFSRVPGRNRTDTVKHPATTTGKNTYKPIKDSGPNLPQTRMAQAAALVSVVLALKLCFLVWRPSTDAPIAGAVPEERILLDAADPHDLLLLPGIGPMRARTIVQYRDSHGPFRQADNLERVPGIGPATRAELAPWLDFGQDDTQ